MGGACLPDEPSTRVHREERTRDAGACNTYFSLAIAAATKRSGNAPKAARADTTELRQTRKGKRRRILLEGRCELRGRWFCSRSVASRPPSF